MTCEEFWNEMPELQAGGGQPDHARECASCAALLQRQRLLAIGLSRMARELDHREAPARVEARILEAFRKQRGARPYPSPRQWLAWGAIAATFVCAISFAVVRQMDRGRPSDLVATSSFAADPASFDSDFIPLPYGTGENTTIEDADLVHVEVPASALAALGLPVEGLSGRVQAVVALGADGVLQGIQIVQ